MINAMVTSIGLTLIRYACCKNKHHWAVRTMRDPQSLLTTLWPVFLMAKYSIRIFEALAIRRTWGAVGTTCWTDRTQMPTSDPHSDGQNIFNVSIDFVSVLRQSFFPLWYDYSLNTLLRENMLTWMENFHLRSAQGLANYEDGLRIWSVFDRIIPA